MDAKIVGGRLRHVMRQLDSFSNGNTHLAAQAPIWGRIVYTRWHSSHW
jgi:hypothetical protein